MYFGENIIKTINQEKSIVEKFEETVNFLDTVCYNEYLNKKSLLESYGSDSDIVLESQVQILYEVSLKDIWNKIVEAFQRLCDFVKEKIEIFKRWYTKKKLDSAEKKYNKAVAKFMEICPDYFDDDFDEWDDDNYEKDEDDLKESVNILNELRLEDKKDRKYYDDNSWHNDNKTTVQHVKQFATYIDSLKDKEDLGIAAYDIDVIKRHINENSKLEEYIKKVCDNDNQFINQITNSSNNGLTENAIKDILFYNNDFEYKDGKIKFNSMLSSGSKAYEIENNLSKMKRSQIVRRLYELHKSEIEAYEYMCIVYTKLSSILTDVMRILKKNKLTTLYLDKFDHEGADKAKNARDNMSKDAFKTLNYIYNIAMKDANMLASLIATCARDINILGLYNNKIYDFIAKVSENKLTAKNYKFSN